MDEKRGYFRVRNNGEFVATFEKEPIEVIDLSANSASIQNTLILPEEGSISLSINQFSIILDYQILQREAQRTIITFKDDEQVNTMLRVLKNFRSSASAS
jgi:hypothetical protein